MVNRRLAVRQLTILAGATALLPVADLGSAKSPKALMFNKWHQLHACPNVYVTDGAAMTSTLTQNPSLTYLAFAARAADHAVSELKKQNLKTT